MFLLFGILVIFQTAHSVQCTSLTKDWLSMAPMLPLSGRGLDLWQPMWYQHFHAAWTVMLVEFSCHVRSQFQEGGGGGWNRDGTLKSKEVKKGVIALQPTLHVLAGIIPTWSPYFLPFCYPRHHHLIIFLMSCLCHLLAASTYLSWSLPPNET